ncbi:MAG: SMP-30/gluconolactonase/LRE family protein, partial [Acidimicrobiia bacterium]|nr:SMP-30/gluconolactonase/LRE family protein [Acidimicrobiia bacterium]
MSDTPRIDCVAAADARLGESPVWDSEAGLLWWVDIGGRAVHRYDPVSNRDEETSVSVTPAALAVRERGGLVLATDDGFWAFNPDQGRISRLAPDPEPD